MLTLSAVSARYGSVPAINDISISVGEGEAVGLLGANGAGKSTTLRAISGLIRTTSGSITFLGADLARSASVRRGFTQSQVAVALAAARGEPVHQRQQLLGRHRTEQDRDAAQVLVAAAERHQRDDRGVPVVADHTDQLAPAQPFEVQVQHDEPRHRLHQHLGGFQTGRDRGHRIACPFQHRAKHAPGRRIGVCQENHYLRR